MDSEKKGKTRKRPKARPWIPAPALSSNLDKDKAGKRKTDKAEDPEGCGCDSHADFEVKLKGLLSEIHQLKNYLTSDQNEQELIEQKDKLVESTRAVEELEKTIEKAIEELRLLQRDDGAYRKSFAATKDELRKRLEENERLARQQKALVEKLSRVEANATQAVEQVVALRSFIGKLNKLSDPRGAFSPQTGRKYAQDILTKIQELDRANQSLQKIILDAPRAVEDNRDAEENAKDESDVAKLAGKVTKLRANVEEDRRQILQLRATVHSVRQESAREKEELKKTVSQHKERANKYLSVVDDLKLQLSITRNELGAAKQEAGSLKLQNLCLTSERDRLEIEKTTLIGKCSALESRAASHSLMMTGQSEELSSKLVHFSSKIGMLEVENEKLKAQLDDSRREIDRCKSDLRQQQEELRAQRRNSGPHPKNGVDRSAQVSLVELPESSSKSQSNDGREHWLQMTELWKELQTDKLNILQVLKDLERKLEKSQDVNSEFRRELSKKEDAMQEINSRLQEKVEENKSLKRTLESAIAEAKQMSERAREASLSMDQVTRSKLADLEKQVREYKTENSQLRKSQSEVEKNLSLQVKELQERAEQLEASKKALHEYIAFLKSSYASVFGDASLATKNYPF